jgi:carbon storage regulator CsrA
MLVLERRHGQDVVIRAANGDVIVITVLGGRTSLGFKAPRSYVIDRAEVDMRKQAERP